MKASKKRMTRGSWRGTLRITEICYFVNFGLNFGCFVMNFGGCFVGYFGGNFVMNFANCVSNFG